MVLALALLIDSPEPMHPVHLRTEYLVEPLAVSRPDPRFSWELEGGGQGAYQSAYRITVTRDGAAVWDSGKRVSRAQSGVKYAGAPLEPATQYRWKVEVWQSGTDAPEAAESSFSTGLANWVGEWLTDPQPVPPHEDPTTLPPLPPCYFRRDFAVGDGLVSATLYSTALGCYKATLNGKAVGDHVLAPEWIDYTQRVMYQAYDVTELLRTGENTIGVLLGDGWYAGRLGMSQALHPGRLLRGVYGRRPSLLGQLLLRYSDGTTETIATDKSWKLTTNGPVRFSDILDGESYDGSLEMPGWDEPGFDDGGWLEPKVSSLTDKPKVLAQPNEPIRVFDRLAARTVSEPKPGVFVFDFGQNHAGFLEADIEGAPGAEVRFRHAEMLQEDGTVYTANLRGAPQVDKVTLPASGKLSAWSPSFTYHGYRYVQVEGLDKKPEAASIRSLAFASSAPSTATFACSDPATEQLWSNILWTQRANLMGVPTDCPQRDERLGWTGDILAYGPTAMYRMDLAAFFVKWFGDVRDAQAEDGRYPDFAPHPYGKDERFTGVPGWGDAGVGCAWLHYCATGDKDTLSEHFSSMARYLDWVAATNPSFVWSNARHNDYGDWLNGNTLVREGWDASGSEVPKDAFGTLMWYRSAKEVAAAASALGMQEEAKKYEAMASHIAEAFRAAFVSPDGKIVGDTQAGYALAIDFGILTAAQEKLAVRHLANAVLRRGGAHTTGFHSTLPLMRSLSDHGYNELAYAILLRKEFPGWGYSIANGATSIWERWDGYVSGRGFQDPGMNSFSHYALGAVGQWVMESVVGIRAFRNPGEVEFRPQPGPGLTWAKGSYRTLAGLYKCEWKIEGGKTVFAVTVPPNQSARLTLPGPVEESAGLEWSDAGRRTTVPAGTYRFVCAG